MTDSPDAPPPDDAPLSVGEEEVERLLQEAEALTAQIAEDAGVDAEPADPEAVPGEEDHDPPGEEGEARPDALTAAAKVEQAAKGLGDLLTDADADASTGTTTPSPAAPASETPEDELASLPAPQQDADDFDGFSGLTAEDHAVFNSATDGDAGTDGEDEVQAPGGRPAEDGDETPSIVASAHPEPVAWSQLCVRGLQSTVSRLRQAPKAVPAALRAAIIWTDKPFADISLGVKRILGAVALASILTGIAAWVLPGALAHNPFADMPTHTAVDGGRIQSIED